MKIVQVNLSDQSAEYFQKVYESLETGTNETSQNDVVNYVFETLDNLENMIGDPADFMHNLAKGNIILMQKPKKPVIQPEEPDEQKEQKEKRDRNSHRIGDLL